MQIELRLLQQRLGISTIVVTHDQREAMTMADIVVIMDHGRVQQVASPLDSYRSPSNAFVADFIGISNLVPGTLRGRDTVLVDSRPIRVARLPDGIADGAPVTLSVRPEEVHVRPGPGERREPPRRSGHLRPRPRRQRRDHGALRRRRRCSRSPPRASGRAVQIGDPVAVELPAAACVVLPS